VWPGWLSFPLQQHELDVSLAFGQGQCFGQPGLTSSVATAALMGWLLASAWMVWPTYSK
jgi:hypothetical protein